MSALTDKYEAVKADVIQAEGWLYVHLHTIMACAGSALVGFIIGHFWR